VVPCLKSFPSLRVCEAPKPRLGPGDGNRKGQAEQSVQLKANVGEKVGLEGDSEIFQL